MRIEINKYDPEWIVQFQKIRNELAAILKELNPRIEHIGSTAVPNLAAKPVIDILVGLESASDLDNTIEPMIGHGYIYYEVFNAVVPERRLFVGLRDTKFRADFEQIYSDLDQIPHEAVNSQRLSHVHVWEYGTQEWNRHIAFRDYLRHHEDVRMEYEKLKIGLSTKIWRDGMEYNDGKNDFIKEVEAKALAWYDKQHSDVEAKRSKTNDQ